MIGKTNEKKQEEQTFRHTTSALFHADQTSNSSFIVRPRLGWINAVCRIKTHNFKNWYCDSKFIEKVMLKRWYNETFHYVSVRSVYRKYPVVDFRSCTTEMYNARRESFPGLEEKFPRRRGGLSGAAARLGPRALIRPWRPGWFAE